MDMRKRRGEKAADFCRKFSRNKAAVFGFAVAVVFILAALFADVICSYDKVTTQNIVERLQSPSAAHWFGTDQLGRDIFARIIHGARVSLGVSFLVVAISVLVGGIAGSLLALTGGRIDNLVMRLIDVISCIPGFLLTLALVAAMGSGIRNLMLAMCIRMSVGYIRVIRSFVLSVVGQDFIDAARISGMSTRKIAVTHVLPNALGIIIVEEAMSLSNTILSIAALSFLGLGIQPPAPEWGAMLNEGREFIRTYPHLIIIPGIAIALSALAMNLMGDGVRDALDPRSGQ